ncbi:MAG TPA: hypothetical protein VD838_19710, partial [Anaeromyxobacteraceae bacterium]|nr:hypothetical protein [Anaeromyxobacteraceae bacterium]
MNGIRGALAVALVLSPFVVSLSNHERLSLGPAAAYADVDQRAPQTPSVHPERRAGEASPKSRGGDANFKQVREALALLLDEDVERAKAIVEPLLAERPDDPDVLLVGGILRFYEQRYDDAVLMLEEVA